MAPGVRSGGHLFPQGGMPRTLRAARKKAAVAGLDAPHARVRDDGDYLTAVGDCAAGVGEASVGYLPASQALKLPSR